MGTKIHLLRCSRLLAVLCGLLLSTSAQTVGAKAPENNDALKSFVGVWQAQCGDQKIFLILTLKSEGSVLSGNVSVGNMSGNDEGGCEVIVDPPAPEHAQQISETKLKADGTLTFKGAKRQDGSYNEFEMKLLGGNKANLKFIGTPVEKHPWEIVRQS